MSADAALAQLLRRGGFPEPCLAPSDIEAERWRRQYATDLIREDVMEFSRLHEVNTMRVFFEMLREHAGLHYLRTKDGAEVDFCLSGGGVLTYLIECKLTDAAPHRALVRFATQFVQAQAVQLVHTLRHNESRPPVHIEKAAPWLMRLAA